MNIRLPWFIALIVILGQAPSQGQLRHSPWEQSLVTLEVTQKRYDHLQPWAVETRNLRKDGLVLKDEQILTTAEGLNDRALIRLQKGGRGLWTIGELVWIDYHANLALVTASDPFFWKDLRPAELPSSLDGANLDNLQIARWRNYKLEFRKAEFNEFTVDLGSLSFVPHVYMVINGEIEDLGYGETLLEGDQVLGLASRQSGNRGWIIPAPFIRSILQARSEDKYRGLGYFDFVWQPSENPAIHASLQWQGEPQGVVVIEVPSKLAQTPVLKKFDLILKVDEFSIDTHGDYEDPEFGHLQLENLSSR